MKNNLSNNKTLTLGEIIEKLESLSPDMIITFDFCGFIPTTFDSWRGVYSQLALGYQSSSNKDCAVSDLLRLARESNMETFQGYGGGDYVMTITTPVWVSNYGEYACNYSGILDIQAVSSENCIIITGYCE